jgi:hypothetical protein
MGRPEEAMARVYYSDRGVPSIGLRPATVLGVGRDDGLTAAPTQAELAAASGQAFHGPYTGRSHFHYADDLARMFLACARADHDGAEAFNIRGPTVDTRDVVETIESVAGLPRGTITCGGRRWSSRADFPLIDMHTPCPWPTPRTTVAWRRSALVDPRLRDRLSARIQKLSLRMPSQHRVGDDRRRITHLDCRLQQGLARDRVRRAGERRIDRPAQRRIDDAGLDQARMTTDACRRAP